MQKPYTDHICRLKQQQQEPQTGENLYSAESIAEVLDQEPNLRAALDRLLAEPPKPAQQISEPRP